ncbi:sulfite reductase (NADPH) flavoprotein alpha subunit [Escherichia coli]|uniref:Sulfite reductase (NADPH) flavoprotein alpha subunit n=1 Tax=Escherichia coli TaxID=562 RepID=A0A377CUW0_ECOLX|nr:sulfite reductase (NADPH) flavoprotein alpha subunit [Escherichia coli]
MVRYDVEGRARAGGASSFLADRVEKEGEVRVFIEHNDNFRLPANPETPVIMIGPGTGIAPFRAFMQQRAADEAPGKNWLFFGNPHFTEDFLYQWSAALRQRGCADAGSISPGRATKKKKFTYKTNCANRARSCGAGSMTVPTFMSAVTLIAWRKTLSRHFWK